MSEHSIAQTDATQPERWWFTFGSGQTHPLTGADLMDTYVVLPGTYEEARAAMIASPFGNRWAFQYGSAELAGVGNFRLRQVPMPDPGDEDLNPLDEWSQPDDQPEAAAQVEPEPDPKRAAYTQGLREIADWLDAHPEVPMPHLSSTQTGKWEDVLSIFLVSGDQRAALATIARAMGEFEKVADGEDFRVVRRFGSIAVVAQADRDEVCERVVTATREETVEVPDPEALAAVPKVSVTRTVEDVEWVCSPLLGRRSKPTQAEVAEAALVAS